MVWVKDLAGFLRFGLALCLVGLGVWLVGRAVGVDWAAVRERTDAAIGSVARGSGWRRLGGGVAVSALRDRGRGEVAVLQRVRRSSTLAGMLGVWGRAAVGGCFLWPLRAASRRTARSTVRAWGRNLIRRAAVGTAPGACGLRCGRCERLGGRPSPEGWSERALSELCGNCKSS